MIPIKDYIANSFIGKTFHFVCDCIIPMDIIGTVKEYSISNNEIILLISTNTRILHIGLNTPSLVIEEIK